MRSQAPSSSSKSVRLASIDACMMSVTRVSAGSSRAATQYSVSRSSTYSGMCAADCMEEMSSFDRICSNSSRSCRRAATTNPRPLTGCCGRLWQSSWQSDQLCCCGHSGAAQCCVVSCECGPLTRSNRRWRLVEWAKAMVHRIILAQQPTARLSARCLRR